MAPRYQAVVAKELRKYGLRYEDLYDPQYDLVSPLGASAGAPALHMGQEAAGGVVRLLPCAGRGTRVLRPASPCACSGRHADLEALLGVAMPRRARRGHHSAGSLNAHQGLLQLLAPWGRAPALQPAPHTCLRGLRCLRRRTWTRLSSACPRRWWTRATSG